MRARIECPSGMDGLGGTHACVLERFDDKALCVTLESADDPGSCLLLGDVTRVAPGTRVELEEEDSRQIDGWQEEGCGVFCRLGIPRGEPGAAGFDTDRLVLVNFRSGLGMERERPWMGVVPFSALKARRSG